MIVTARARLALVNGGPAAASALVALRAAARDNRVVVLAPSSACSSFDARLRAAQQPTPEVTK